MGLQSGEFVRSLKSGIKYQEMQDFCQESGRCEAQQTFSSRQEQLFSPHESTGVLGMSPLPVDFRGALKSPMGERKSRKVRL